MLTFMNSKLTKTTGKDKQNYIFQKVNPMKHPVQIYIYTHTHTYIYIYIYTYWWGPRIYHVFYWCIPLDHEIYTKCNKTSNLIKGSMYSHNICSEIKRQQLKNRNISHSVPKTSDFSQNSSVPFHRVTFDHSISCMLLIDKPNESCWNLKEMPYPPQKKSF